MEVEERLQQNLEKLRRNREKVPRKMLLTKYAAAYRSLLKEIRQDACEVFRSALLAGITFREEDRADVDAFAAAVQRILIEERGDLDHAMKVLLRTADLKKALDSLMSGEAARRIYAEAYAPYWLRSCIPVTHEDRVGFHSELTGLDWDEAHGIWTGRNGKMVSVAAMLPPTMDLIKTEYQHKERGVRT